MAASLSSKMTRFPDINNEEEKEILENIDAKNTKKATATAVKVFREYLRQKGKDVEFERYSAEDLDAVLSRFYLEARSEKGEHYKKVTLMSYRHGIQRHLEQSRRDIDIIRGPNFKNSIKSFKAMGKELKRIGRAAIEHYPPIADADMAKLYEYVCSSESSVFLQYKVFIDLMLHFGRRGRENLAALKITDLAVTTDADGDMFVYLTTDERTKNHQDDSDRASGRMYERKDDSRCPVRSFVKVKYVRRLDKSCLKLFQQPTSDDHYIGVPLGHNRLGSMMASLSVKAALSVRYTNHSLRATTVHVLDAAQVPFRHIMTVTGHKAESSLKTYTGYTDEKTKKRMSAAISNRTCTDVRPTAQSAVPVCDDPDLKDFLNDSDFDYILQNLPINNNFNMQVPTRVTSNQNSLFQMPVPVLYNCNVTINYNFQGHQ